MLLKKIIIIFAVHNSPVLQKVKEYNNVHIKMMVIFRGGFMNMTVLFTNNKNKKPIPIFFVVEKNAIEETP